MPDPRDHPAVARVRAALESHAPGRAGEHGVRILDDSARTAEEAASALGVDVAQIVKSMVFAADGAPLLVLTSGRHQVDTAKVAAITGAAEVNRADADFVRTHTGFAIGGVAPLGHPAPIMTLVDETMAAYDVLWAAAGHPHAVFPLTYDELVAFTAGTPADIAR